MLGTLGIRAGSQPEPGIYFSDRLLWYAAAEVRDRSGVRVPLGLDLDALANAVGFVGVFELPLSTLLSVAAGAPITRIRASTDRPEASTDRFGLGDAYVQPARLGWRFSRWDVVAGYALYLPTGRYGPGGGIGQGQLSHEISAGGTAYLDPTRAWSLSALASYVLNRPKRGIDITRGNTVQIQGGMGVLLWGMIEPGLTGYALWQVSDDTGADLPPVFRGARDRAFGLGTQVNVLLPPILGKLSVNFAHDLLVRSRPLGQTLIIGLSIAAWKPS